MRSASSLATVALSLVLMTSGCSRCSGSTTNGPDAAPSATPNQVVDVEVLPPPAPWKFELLRIGPGMRGTALPPGCRLREPLVRAKVGPSTRFVAAPGALGTLVVADADTAEVPPKLMGVAAVLLDPAGTTTNPAALPWVEAGAMPRLARAKSGKWLAAFTEPGEDKLAQVFVFQNQGAVSLGEGDKFETVDLGCDDDQCALLTTRFGRVAAAGADVWLGKPEELATSWRRIEIVPVAGDSDARPSCIARMDASVGAARGPVVALFEGSDLGFWSVTEVGGPREIGRVAAPHGIVDATMLGRPVALVYGAPIDEDGCAKQGGIMHFTRPGAPDVDVRPHAPATNGVLRPLAKGGLATYLAPLGCGATRKVVYAVVLAEDGAPISPPMAVSDAASFAVTTRGENVDLWIQRDEEVVWVRATCAAP